MVKGTAMWCLVARLLFAPVGMGAIYRWVDDQGNSILETVRPLTATRYRSAVLPRHRSGPQRRRGNSTVRRTTVMSLRRAGRAVELSEFFYVQGIPTGKRHWKTGR